MWIIWFCNILIVAAGIYVYRSQELLYEDYYDKQKTTK